MKHLSFIFAFQLLFAPLVWAQKDDAAYIGGAEEKSSLIFQKLSKAAATLVNFLTRGTMCRPLVEKVQYVPLLKVKNTNKWSSTCFEKRKAIVSWKDSQKLDAEKTCEILEKVFEKHPDLDVNEAASAPFLRSLGGKGRSKRKSFAPHPCQNNRSLHQTRP